MFAFAPMCDREIQSAFSKTDSGISYTLTETFELLPGGSHSAVFYWGLGFEEVAAATSAKEMLRRGWDWEYQRTTLPLPLWLPSNRFSKRWKQSGTRKSHCMKHFYSLQMMKLSIRT